MHAELSTLDNSRGKHFFISFCPSLTKGGPAEVGSLTVPGCMCVNAKYPALTTLSERSKARKPKAHGRRRPGTVRSHQGEAGHGPCGADTAAVMGVRGGT